MPDERNEEIIEAIVQSLDERDRNLKSASGSQWAAIRKFVAIKDIAMAVVFFGSLVGGAFLMIEELKSKPSQEDMTEAIETRVRPIEHISKKNEADIREFHGDMKDVRVKIDRIQDVNEVILEQNSYQGDVLHHLAEGKKPPEKPEILKAKERNLMK